jgi:hypothetical protein
VAAVASMERRWWRGELLLEKTEVGRGRAMLGDDRPFYRAHGGRCRDGWQAGGRMAPTGGPSVGLSVTDRWAVLQLFSNSKIIAEIKLFMGKIAKE